MKREGFTIVELMVVMLVIAILIGITLPRFKGMQDQAKISKAESETKTLQTAVESYYINQSPFAYPATTGTISTPLIAATPQIIDATMVDPFSTSSAEYQYIRSTDTAFYVIFSVGPDATADITGIADGTGALAGVEDDDIFATNGSGW